MLAIPPVPYLHLVDELTESGPTIGAAACRAAVELGSRPPVTIMAMMRLSMARMHVRVVVPQE